MGPENLDVNVKDEIRARESFGKIGNQIKGVCGTFQLTREEDSDKLIPIAWDLSRKTGLPAIVVIRAPKA